MLYEALINDTLCDCSINVKNLRLIDLSWTVSVYLHMPQSTWVGECELDHQSNTFLNDKIK